MKSLSTLLYLMALATGLSAQNLQSTSLLPPNPTSTDTVKVIAELMFTSGGCDLVSSYSAVNANLIEVEVKHCTGFLAVICYATDTITIGTLQPGSYQLDFSVFTGSFDFNGNCTNFQTGGQQSLQFQVSGTSDIPEKAPARLHLRFDNEKNQLVLNGTESECHLRLVDLTGRTLLDESISSGPIPVSRPLPKGIYVYTLHDTRGNTHSGRLVVN